MNEILSQLFDYLPQFETLVAIVGIIAALLSIIPALIKFSRLKKEQDVPKPAQELVPTEKSTIRGISRRTELLSIFPRAFLVESNTGRIFSISGAMSLGSDVNNDIVLEDPTISRFHAKISGHENGEFVIHDLHSTNGTFVNGTLITTSHILNDGDQINLGRQRFVFNRT